MPNGRTIAYFSMEIGIDPAIPTYSGGLGVLAGDTIKSAADLGLPMAAVTLLDRKGYFYQRLDTNGQQTEEPVDWVVDDYLVETDARATVQVEGRDVVVRAWRYDVNGITGATVPVYFLDTFLPENSQFDSTLTDYLYGNDDHYRLCQEVVLGIGGVRMLRALGYDSLTRFHMNEGHSALMTLELLDEQVRESGRNVTNTDIEAVRRMCVFTTHTPVPAGHDKFPIDIAQRVITHPQMKACKDKICTDGYLNMTYVALNLSQYVNGVAKKHGETSAMMFAPFTIDSITNGVHAATWVSPPFSKLFDKYIEGWREDNYSLRYAVSIPKNLLWNAHTEAKLELIRHLNGELNAGFDKDFLTLGFARRSTKYKRANLLLQDADRLVKIAGSGGPVQIVYGGKAHPKDEEGKALIRSIFDARRTFKHDVRIVYVPNYDIFLAKTITAGVDLWLNTPEPPMEASGTSGMKAALNGVPSLSVLDGWWVEGCIENVTGWAIGDGKPDTAAQGGRPADLDSLYDKLEHTIIPMFYRDRDAYISIMRNCIGLNGSFFNTQRMIDQYVSKAYFGRSRT